MTETFRCQRVPATPKWAREHDLFIGHPRGCDKPPLLEDGVHLGERVRLHVEGAGFDGADGSDERGVSLEWPSAHPPPEQWMQTWPDCNPDRYPAEHVV